ncbi:glycosyltransferase family 2 protein [Novilysobacter luteus]|nr:glycosyltransferase family 2 protein [Lysobacter luteus]
MKHIEGTIDPILTPLQQLQAAGKTEHGFPLWRATGDDPAFLCRIDPIPGGWYQLDLRVDVVSGRLSTPCLYVDYGQGFSEAGKIEFAVDVGAGGRFDGNMVVMFPAPVVALRFDPTIMKAKLGLPNPRLHRLGRVEAARRLVADGLRARTGFQARMRFVLEILRRGVSGGRRALGDFLYASSRVHHHRSMDPLDYGRWLDTYGSLPGATETSGSETGTAGPLVSVVMPTYNTPERWLRRCIESVREQTYTNWELCIADDASPQPHVARILDEYARLDPRVRYVVRDTNGHISHASNTALDIARGEYIALLDHDDELHPRALQEMMSGFAAHPRWRMAYSDEDKIDDQGMRFDPYFKPDWNHDLLLSHNCVSHFGVYERALVESVGRFRGGFEGSQDWDLALRCIEQLDSDQIGHVPHVLYHWRAIPGSTALAPGEKNYAHLAAMKSLQSHLERVGRDAEVMEIPRHPGNYRIRNALPAQPPKVSVVIATRDRSELLSMAVRGILQDTDYPDLEVVIVDNGSVERRTLDYLARMTQDSRVRVIRHGAPFNYSELNNLGVKHASGEVICLLNNDIEVTSPDWLKEMVSQALRPDIGAVGAMLYFPDGTIQHAGIVLGFNGVAVSAYGGRPKGWFGHMFRARLLQNYSAVTAACMVLRKSLYEDVGGLDEGLAVAYNDVDLCLRIHARGYRNLWTPYSELVHHESASRGPDDVPERRERFLHEVNIMKERWPRIIARDPAYSPNLAIVGDTFDYAFPPRHKD